MDMKNLGPVALPSADAKNEEILSVLKAIAPEQLANWVQTEQDFRAQILKILRDVDQNDLRENYPGVWEKLWAIQDLRLRSAALDNLKTVLADPDRGGENL